MNIHDFRIVDGMNTINLIFDIEVPADYSEIDNLKSVVTEKIRQIDERFNPVIVVDTIYN